MLQWVKSQVYNFITTIINLKTQPVEKNTLLLIRTNNMGDYVLWRDMMKFIRKSERFKNHRITLLGNPAWKSLFEPCDSEFVDEVIWADMPRFKKDMRYRYHLQKKIHDKGFSTVINTQHSRCKRTDDAFTLVCKSAHRMGEIADNSNVLPYEKGYDDKLFDEVYPHERVFEFEFTRSIRSTEFFLHEKLPAEYKPELTLDIPLPDELVNKNYFILFPGSSNPKRIWDPQNFKKVGEFVTQRYNWVPVICGSKSDKPFVDALLSIYTEPIINLSGRTSLIQFANVLRHAKLTVSIDTGTVHLAAVAGGTVFGLFNGSHYGRWNPYPSYINPNIYGIYPNQVEKELASNPIPVRYNWIVDVDYNDISAEKVCKKIEENIKG